MASQVPGQEEEALPLPPGTHPRTYLSTLDDSKQPFNLFVPSVAEEKPGELLPLVVVLHGKGATWESWFAAVPIREWAEQEGYIVVAPHGRGNWFYLGQGERDLLDVLDEVQALVYVDPERIYLMGHSMGGWGTWHTACARPDLFAAIVPMSGWAPLDLLGSLRHLPVLAIHGDADDAVPVDGTRQANARLGELRAAAGGAEFEHVYIELPGVGHESAMIGKMLPQIGDWLRGKRRVTKPSRLSIAAYTTTRSQQYWGVIREITKQGRLATLDVEAKGAAEIDVKTGNVTGFALNIGASPLEAEGKELGITIDGARYTIKIPAKPRMVGSTGAASFRELTFAVICQRLDAGWRLNLSPAHLVFRRFPPPSLGNTSGMGEESPAARIASLLAAAVSVDAVALPKDYVAPVLREGMLSLDTVLDIYLRPDDELVRFELSATQWAALVEAKDWFPPWWGELVLAPVGNAPEDGQTISVAAPVNLARMMAEKLGIEGTPTGAHIREILVDLVLEKGEI